MRTFDEVILLLYNINSRNITVLKFSNRSRYAEVLVKVFFVNHTDFQGGIIPSVSHIDKKIKVFSRRGKLGFRLLFSGLLCFTGVKSARDYNAYCVSNRNNQILYVIIQKNGIMFYHLFDISNNTLIDRQDNFEDETPELYFNE